MRRSALVHALCYGWSDDARQRPGPELAEDEILSAILGDAVDGLESLQATGPVPGIEDIAGAIRFVRYG